VSLKVQAAIKLEAASGSWNGVVRRIGSRLDLLVETSGKLKVGETASFELDIPEHDGVASGLVRVRNAGERAGPYTRYILQITEASARDRQTLQGWMRGQLGARNPTPSRAVPTDTRRRMVSEAAERAAEALRYPKGSIEVEAPLAMRTESGSREGTLIRFHGTEFLVELAQPIEPVGQAFFQFEVPGYGIEVYGTARFKLEAWSDPGSHGYVLEMHLMRRADRDLLLEWLHDQVEEPLGDDASSGPAISDMPTNVPSDLPPDNFRLMASSASRKPGDPPPPAAENRDRSGRDSIREVLRRRFFGKGK
jgi:hypothetical protein